MGHCLWSLSSRWDGHLAIVCPSQFPWWLVFPSVWVLCVSLLLSCECLQSVILNYRVVFHWHTRVAYPCEIRNYITDTYQTLAASANAASSCSRSFFATFLPLAGYPMLKNVGIPGTCSLLGGLSAVMSIVPFLLIWKGSAIRSRSRFRQGPDDQERKDPSQSPWFEMLCY